jgi:hypothetical protein
MQWCNALSRRATKKRSGLRAHPIQVAGRVGDASAAVAVIAAASDLQELRRRRPRPARPRWRRQAVDAELNIAADLGPARGLGRSCSPVATGGGAGDNLESHNPGIARIGSTRYLREFHARERSDGLATAITADLCAGIVQSWRAVVASQYRTRPSLPPAITIEPSGMSVASAK